MTIALDKVKYDVKNNIKVLNLSQNLLGKEGIKILAKFMSTNTSIETLDVSQNKIGVSGAVQLS